METFNKSINLNSIKQLKITKVLKILSIIWLFLLLCFSVFMLINNLSTGMRLNWNIAFLYSLTWIVFVYLAYNAFSKEIFIKIIAMISLITFFIMLIIMLVKINNPSAVSFGMRDYQKELCVKYIGQISLKNFFCHFGFILFSFAHKYSWFADIINSLFGLLFFFTNFGKKLNVNNKTYLRIATYICFVFAMFLPTFIYLFFGIIIN
ncbi:MAG: hypothetical protein AB7U85_05120 [Alphaproteobacteria bacterium]